MAQRPKKKQNIVIRLGNFKNLNCCQRNKEMRSIYTYDEMEIGEEGEDVFSAGAEGGGGGG